MVSGVGHLRFRAGQVWGGEVVGPVVTPSVLSTSFKCLTGSVRVMGHDRTR